MSTVKTITYGATILAAVLGSSLAIAQTVPPPQEDPSAGAWHSDSAVYVAGFDGPKQNTTGRLRIAEDDLVFSGKEGQGQIPLRRITAVYISDERVATGGTSAKLARKIPIFGFGAVAGAVTSKTVDVLTVEYRDDHAGYHGAVFEVPKTQAEVAKQQLMPFAMSPQHESDVPVCNGPAIPNTLLVAPIGEQDLQLPAEYRVLLYEQLVAELKKEHAGGTVLRVGDRDAACPSQTLRITVGEFKKGNEKVRSETGPIGLFVGGTSVAFNVRLTDNAGVVVFDKRLKNSKHGDSDSLGVASAVAQSVLKRLAKTRSTGFGTAA